MDVKFLHKLFNESLRIWKRQNLLLSLLHLSRRQRRQSPFPDYSENFKNNERRSNALLNTIFRFFQSTLQILPEKRSLVLFIGNLK